MASLTEVAVFEAREEVEQNLRGSFMEELRARTDLEATEIVRRAGRSAATCHGARWCSAPSCRATGPATWWR